ncbi:YiiX/YebB-like N1pC/P60 family cysteine hydrolase [Halomonas elongata]|uniref:YiiX/YebB-like N1pC/P60 family cysteine hydrolase n=1 Tax=Halomonas elongata TaxID=2746 RepID=UPI0023B1FFD5|nr:YiiX/YebB-like N1pC/P60 family cysteine hydrolase [Halomonas elongata]
MMSLHGCGYVLSCWLSCPRPWLRERLPDEGDVQACLMPGDVLLVDGSSRISTVIKYLTQSTWSHAALYVGEAACRQRFGVTRGECFVEADLSEGVRLVGTETYARDAVRICRPVGLRPGEIEQLVEYVCQRVGQRYDLRNLFDLARYLLPLPPVPSGWRRYMLGLGSGDPTRAICSTLIAQAFQAVNYPILPLPVGQTPAGTLWRRRHYSLFTPKDFDISPYFAIIKPKLVHGFDAHTLHWQRSSATIAAKCSIR